MDIPFNRPHMTGHELEYIQQAHSNLQLSGNGPFTKQCHHWLEEKIGCPKALLTHSCTAALEMAALILDLGPGDEVIMPSFTFVSTANAFALRGAVPVFVDIRPDTFNLDERLLDQALTSRTKAVVVVHYAGVACEMDAIVAWTKKHSLVLIEDSAQAILSRYKGIPLGRFGQLACLSFHETKNITCGEGGALLINDPSLIHRAEVVWEKGTDRSRFFKGEVDKYTWQDLGSSFLPGEITAAFLKAQLEASEDITAERLAIWKAYHDFLGPLEAAGRLRRPLVPENCQHNAHCYSILLPNAAERDRFIREGKEGGIQAVFHYLPLHDAPAGRRFGRPIGELPVTRSVSERLVRLPLWFGLRDHLPRIFDALGPILSGADRS